jgi:hypothetical protein
MIIPAPEGQLLHVALVCGAASLLRRVVVSVEVLRVSAGNVML